jgi:hypothetical protein
MFPFKGKALPVKAAIIEKTDVGSFFAVVLGTLLVAFVLPQLASWLFTSNKKKQVLDEDSSTSSRIERRMAEREFYRYSKNVTTPNVFEPYEEDDSDGEEHDWDDEITVQSLMEVHKKGDFPESRKVREKEAKKEEKPEEKQEVKEKEEKVEDKEEESASNTSNWRCACEGGFLPPGLLKSFGGAEAVIRMSTGQCYHKQ